jgi:hypothetical protein
LAGGGALHPVLLAAAAATKASADTPMASRERLFMNRPGIVGGMSLWDVALA